MKKKLPATELVNELAGASAFFQKSAVQGESHSSLEKENKPVSATKPQKIPTPPSSSVPGVSSDPVDTHTPSMVQENKDIKTSRRQDVTNDVTTSLLQNINKREWRDIIEETETHNSSLRMSVKEREQMEDLVRTLRRKYKIKTSMNEIARLGLLFLIHDFAKNGDKSIIAEVKKS